MQDNEQSPYVPPPRPGAKVISVEQRLSDFAEVPLRAAFPSLFHQQGDGPLVAKVSHRGKSSFPGSGDDSAAVAAIRFALETDDGLSFLRAWLHGDFPEIRRDWPEAPAAVFAIAEPGPSGAEATDAD